MSGAGPVSISLSVARGRPPCPSKIEGKERMENNMPGLTSPKGL